MNENKTNINWYPGHMAKAKRLIKEQIKLIDIIYEVIDARIPNSSRIKDLDEIIGNKPRIILMTKIDLCDLNKTNKWKEYYESIGYHVILLDLINNKNINKIYEETEKVLKNLNVKRKEKGLSERSYRAMILGIPNVGKSTLINRITGRKSVKVGNKPGVTKSLTWIRIGDNIDLMDTPGILWPKIDDETVAFNLAAFSAIKEEILPIGQVACYILKYMFKNYKNALHKRYGIEKITDDFLEEYDIIGNKRGCLLKGNEIDYDKVSKLIIKDLIDGNLGRVTFDEI